MTKARLRRFARRRTRSAMRRRPRSVFTLEPLEPRVLLSAAFDAPSSDLNINPVWFAEVSPARSSLNTDASAIESIGPSTATVQWDGLAMESIADQWIIRLDDAIAEGVSNLESVVDLLDLQTFGAHVVRGLGLEGMILLETDSAADTDLLITTLKTHDLIAYAQPNVIIDAQLFASDPSFGSLYGLHNTGQSGGTADADIDAPEAWELTTGDSSVVVGVIDTGIDYTHADIAPNIWINPGEIAGNGIDDDGNGFVDDIHGFDFVNNDGDPMDDNGHGTHVAGTIAAAGDNGTGVVGVTWSTSLMALKFLSASGSGSTADAVRAVNYATMMRTQYGVDVRVTNNSWGGGGSSNAMREAIAASQAADMLFIAAAGNDGTDNDAEGHYPSNYDLDSVISVAATDRNDNLASFSNYGATTVDLAAPGVSILSTLPDNSYANYSGTSMATPHVAGVAALAFAYAPTASAAEVRDAIFASADPIDSLTGKMVTGGRLNAYGTLALLDAASVEPGDPDAYEDNDTRQQVDALVAGALNSANLGVIVDAVTLDNLATDDGDDDWFRFEMGGTGRDGDGVRIDFDHDAGNLDLTVFAADGVTVVGRSATNGDFEFVDLAGEAAGVYYAFIRSSLTARSDNYSLTIDPGASGSVTGVVFQDLDGDGVRDDGESGIEDVVVYIDSNDNGEYDVTQMTITAADLPIAVPGSGTRGAVESELAVTGTGGTLVDINVMLDISHTWDGDLSAYLVSPTGTRVELFSEVGGNGDGFSNTFFDDEAAQSITDGAAPFVGTFRPEGSLADFDGELADGTWTLEVNDAYYGDSGTLNGWAIILTTSETSVITNAQGQYTLGDLSEGDVVIRHITPEGKEQTSPSGDGAQRVTVSAGVVTDSADFGLATLVAPPPAPTSPSIQVLGAGTLITDGDDTPDHTDGTDFGEADTALGLITRSFTIRNSGDAALNLLGDAPIIVTGEGFTLVDLPSDTAIDPGASATFTVQFDPSQVGVHEAIVTIASNDQVASTFDFVIVGVGVSPDLAPNHLTYAAGEYERGADLAVSVDLTNIGSADVSTDSDVVVAFRLTMDEVWGNADDVILGSTQLTSGLDISTLADAQFHATLGSNIAAGAYRVAVMVDANDVIDETDESNNIIFSAQPDVVVLDTVTLALESGQTVTYTDADGSAVRIRLTGPGTGQVLLSAGNGVDADRITLTGTTDRSTLRIDGDTTIGSIEIEGMMRQVRGADVDLIEHLTSTGGIKSLQLDDIVGAAIEIGAFDNARSTMTVKLGNMTDAAFDTTAAIRSMRIASWIDTDDVADTFTAVDAVTLQSDGDFHADVSVVGDIRTLRVDGDVRGDWVIDGEVRTVRVGQWLNGSLDAYDLARLDSDGQFAADLDLEGDLGRVTVRGSLGSGDADSPIIWNIGGEVGRIKADVVNGFELISQADANTLDLGAVAHAAVDIAGAIRTVKVSDWEVGTVTANAISSLSTRGDFLADVTLNGSDGGDTLRSARMGGALGGAWHVIGDVGSIRAAQADTWVLTGANHVRQLNLGEVTDVTVDVAGDIRTISAVAWTGGSIDAASVQSLNVRGDFDAAMTLSGATEARNDTLRSARIGGTLSDATWQIAGSVGTIRANETSGFTLVDVAAASQLDLGVVADAQVKVDGEIRTLKAKNWGGGAIEAGSIRSMQVRGDLTAAITLTDAEARYSLDRLSVRGAMLETVVRSAGSINRVDAYSMKSSLVFAGVDDAVTELPSGDDAYVNRDAKIGRITVSGKNAQGAAVVDSVIAAWQIGQASLHSVDTKSDTVAFGLSGDVRVRYA